VVLGSVRPPDGIDCYSEPFLCCLPLKPAASRRRPVHVIPFSVRFPLSKIEFCFTLLSLPAVSNDPFQSPVASRQLPVASRQLPVASCQLPVASRQLPVASNLLHHKIKFTKYSTHCPQKSLWTPVILTLKVEYLAKQN